MNNKEDKQEKSNENNNAKKEKLSKLVGTFFKNALRSNLDLTALADTKAGILISINGFILTVSVTASGFVTHNSIMTFAFISIILTSLGSIILAVMAVKPRHKNKLVKNHHLNGYESLLYYQDMADLEPNEYTKRMKKALFCSEESTDEMITHLHILGSEIKKKYFWLKQAYTFFSVGLIISASLIIYGLLYTEKKNFYNLSTANIQYKKDKFYNIFEPSGATTMPDGNIIIIEDEKGVNSIKLLESKKDGNVTEMGKIYMPKEIKKIFKKDIEDLEAITSHSNTVYLATSHSLNKSYKAKNSREKLIKFTYDDGKITNFHSYGNLKNDLLENFKNYYSKTTLSANSINIEGLSFNNKNKSLLVGFRSPIINSKAIIIEIQNPKRIFSAEKPIFSKPIELDLGGLGIRDMTYDSQKKGYWILAGSVSERTNGFQLWFWDKENSKVSQIKNTPDLGYAEGITIINKNSKKPSLLIVEDNGIKPNKTADYILINKNGL